MNIKYKNKALERQCTDLKKAKMEFGKMGEDVIAKINIIECANSFMDLVNLQSLRCHGLHGHLNDYWAIDVKGKENKLRIILAPLDENGQIVVADNDFFKICKTLKIVLIKEVSGHYE